LQANSNSKATVDTTGIAVAATASSSTKTACANIGDVSSSDCPRKQGISDGGSAASSCSAKKARNCSTDPEYL
uniref:Variant surface glycoprotein n=1 Tax=Gongylonema pulchrum TaxID=637853 RepID=A0A183DMM9_9BILA